MNNSNKDPTNLCVFGSFLGVATGFLATYNTLQQTATIELLLAEAIIWAAWVAIQGLGFYGIFTKDRQSIFVGTALFGIIAMVMEAIAVYQILNQIHDMFLSLVGIGVTVLYVFLVGYSIIILGANDSLAKATSLAFFATAILLLVFPPLGFVLLGFSNLLAAVFLILPE